jgi:hypothetical protein
MMLLFEALCLVLFFNITSVRCFPGASQTVLEILNRGLSIGGPEEIRTPDPQIRSLVLLQRRGDLLDHSMLKCAHTEQ